MSASWQDRKFAGRMNCLPAILAAYWPAFQQLSQQANLLAGKQTIQMTYQPA
jgi:hypothetical protein